MGTSYFYSTSLNIRKCDNYMFNSVLCRYCTLCVGVGGVKHCVEIYAVSVFLIQCIQWNVFINDTLGPANLSTVERLSTLQR